MLTVLLFTNILIFSNFFTERNLKDLDINGNTNLNQLRINYKIPKYIRVF